MGKGTKQIRFGRVESLIKQYEKEYFRIDAEATKAKQAGVQKDYYFYEGAKSMIREMIQHLKSLGE